MICRNSTKTHNKPTLTPPAPTPRVTYCGCSQCTDEVFDTLAGQYTCRARIEWLQSELGYSEFDACKKVSTDKFPLICGKCDPTSCGNTSQSPTFSPTLFPTEVPSFIPSVFASKVPSGVPSGKPSMKKPTPSPFGCVTCNNEVDACKLVTREEFPNNECGQCDPDKCGDSDAPSKIPTPSISVLAIVLSVLSEDV